MNKTPSPFAVFCRKCGRMFHNSYPMSRSYICKSCGTVR